MKTAVKELIEKIESFGFILHDDTKKEFLDKEKQHIFDAYDYGFENTNVSGEQYYNETYNNYETKKSN